MAKSTAKPRANDPVHNMAFHIFCDMPELEGLTPEQICALHEFSHTVMAAGYKLYQVVPQKIAGPIIKKKLGLVIQD